MDRTPTVPTDAFEKERLSKDSDYDAWFRRQVEEGLADMAARRGITNAEMMALIEAQNRRMDAARNP